MSWRSTLFLSLLLLQSCANFPLSRSFFDAMTADDDGIFTPGKDFPVTPGDSGKAHRSADDIQRRTPVTKKKSREQIYQENIKRQISRKERRLTDREYSKYANMDFSSDSQRLYFLNLPKRQRASYLRSFRPLEKSYRRQQQVMDFLTSTGGSTARGLQVGMGKEEVTRRWGRPHRVDIAGNPERENERWSFYQNGTLKQVYFEDGKVEGWIQE